MEPLAVGSTPGEHIVTFNVPLLVFVLELPPSLPITRKGLGPGTVELAVDITSVAVADGMLPENRIGMGEKEAVAPAGNP